jgi:hypothetical protein
MQLSNAPPKIVEAFAVNAAPSGGYGGKRTVPVPSQIAFRPGAASYNDGFPPLTMTPLPGGVPMSGLDMNGILNEATAIDWWKSAGAGWVFDATFAAAVGGYPAGARVFMANGQGYWLNIADNNSVNPDTGSAPTGWIPDRAAASVYASAAQTLAIFNSKVLWDTVEFDTFGLWDAANKRFKALWQGIYRLTGSIYIPASAGQNLSTMIYKNGALAKQACQFPQVSNVALSLPFDAQVYCNEGDYLETYMNIQQTAVSAGAGSGSNAPYVFGQIHYLGY